jgi:hypothetical protein
METKDLDKYFEIKTEHEDSFETLKQYIDKNFIAELLRYKYEYIKSVKSLVGYYVGYGEKALIQSGMEITELQDKDDFIDVILSGEDREGYSYGDAVRIKKEDIGDLKSAAKKMYDNFLEEIEKAKEKMKEAKIIYKRKQLEELKKELGEV